MNVKCGANDTNDLPVINEVEAETYKNVSKKVNKYPNKELKNYRDNGFKMSLLISCVPRLIWNKDV